MLARLEIARPLSLRRGALDPAGRLAGMLTPETVGEYLVARPVLERLRRPLDTRWP